ncbi:polysaccharide pyruvyl transferase family protein [Microbacterium pygmaeum]|uniref:Polysaccharide pyruvyl transferase family protein WcaK n=1 Tax=Microbacterium pygmaeum TaxID=370764 RepID=A0A1G7WH98_9MICO|nr:polysaccharide pyruvyl transferase family protein [Microbacterium pygmaeum]SDG71119.1 Polysaccharide pyruvyl transferase family protein WcaK [Microbacterium pygmaeum]
MRVVVLGDVGVVQGMMHIGDEAMFRAARDELVARGAEIVAVSSVPDETASRYGVGAVPRIRFDGLDRTAAEDRVQAVLAHAGGRDVLQQGDPARAVVEAVHGADGVLIAGGGNLASTWPLHVYERAALGGIARILGRPIVVTGQTLGPDLRGRDRELVGELLAGAALVGVRESASEALAVVFGTVPRLGVDDASFLGIAPTGEPDEARRGVLVSLSLSLGGAPPEEIATRIAALVDAAAETVGGGVRFHAHFGPLDDPQPRGDEPLHELVRARMRGTSTVVPTGDAPAAASLARSSAMLITGRYHPAVFAAPAGVPVVGLVTDRYTAVKQRGALAHWGQDSVVEVSAADRDGIPLLASSWRDRDRIADEARLRFPRHRSETTQWWDAVARSFR